MIFYLRILTFSNLNTHLSDLNDFKVGCHHPQPSSPAPPPPSPPPSTRTPPYPSPLNPNLLTSPHVVPALLSHVAWPDGLLRNAAKPSRPSYHPNCELCASLKNAANLGRLASHCLRLRWIHEAKCQQLNVHHTVAESRFVGRRSRILFRFQVIFMVGGPAPP